MEPQMNADEHRPLNHEGHTIQEGDPIGLVAGEYRALNHGEHGGHGAAELKDSATRIVVLADDIIATVRMCEWLGWVATVGAVAGAILNNFRLWPCFVLWGVSNGLSAWIHHKTGLRSLMARDLIFLALAAVGLWQWTR